MRVGLVTISMVRLWQPIGIKFFSRKYYRSWYLNNFLTRNLKKTDFLATAMATQTTKQSDGNLFEVAFQELLQNLTNQGDVGVKDAVYWFKRVLEYNLCGGKKNRGLSVISSFRLLAKPEELTENNLYKAAVLGWCVELLQAFFLVADDIMDNSEMRRGQLCWYKKDDVGLIAVNDSFFLENAIYILLKKHFRNDSYYLNLVELFHDVTVRTITGQCLDLLSAPLQKVNLDKFTEDRYASIVKYKTSFYSFYLPVALAMHMAGVSNPESFAAAKSILLQMGHFFQVQDDYLDCYGDPNVMGKIGTDIEDNKCSWLVIQALKRVTSNQRTILEENYGKHDPHCVEKVKKLYNDLKLSEIYHEYEESSYKNLLVNINSYTAELPKQIFIEFADRIYLRNK